MRGIYYKWPARSIDLWSGNKQGPLADHRTMRMRGLKQTAGREAGDEKWPKSTAHKECEETYRGGLTQHRQLICNTENHWLAPTCPFKNQLVSERSSPSAIGSWNQGLTAALLERVFERFWEAAWIVPTDRPSCREIARHEAP